ncbi:MAG TPA: SpoIID/LytB domain-containing protein [Rhabdochlamydiaceae bacterium]|nr:SpoIID/LytB domain-containing protein [Rhabdochlamydiaceae bacterium]
MLIPFLLTCCSLCLSPLLLSAASSHVNSIPSDISKKGKPATVKIALEKLTQDLFLDVKGKFLIYHPKTEMLIESGVYGKRGKVAMTRDGLRWGETLPGTFEMRIVPGDSESSILVNGLQYKGALEIYSIGNQLSVINEVDIENYLKSTLAFEAAQVPEELLDMVAIVARTNLYYLARKNKDASWHLDAQKVHYTGMEGVQKSKYVEAAIDKTKHLIMTFNEEPFPAVWSQDCAGKSASYSSVFRKGGTTPPGVDALPSAFHRAKNAWNFTIEKQKLAEIVGIDSITKIDLFNAEKSGKVYALRCSNNEETKSIDFFTLQKALGSNLLKSNDFTLKADESQVVFSGYGQGVGVGLCLSSAEILVKRRENPRKILKTFFPGVQLIFMHTLDSKGNAGEEKISPVWQ